MPGYNVFNDELTQRVRQVVNQYMACNQLRPQPGRRARRGGGGEATTSNLSAFAIVREQAYAATRATNGLDAGLRGKCQLLDAEMQAIPPDPAKGETAESILIEFASLHLVPCRIGAIVLLHSGVPIKPGDTWEDNKIWGQLIHGTDELYELGGHAPEKVLWLPTAANDGDDIRWDGATCP